MAERYDPRSFWNERFRRYGHTGETDDLLYAYDQPQRLRAIDRALSRAGVAIQAGTRILDIGCGTGDLIALFLSWGRPQITGIDLSDEALGYCQSRFATEEQVRLLAVGVEEIEFPPGSFDLVTAVNVLQHITEDQAFARVVDKIVQVVKTGGHILVMDFSPAKVQEKRPAPYLIIRAKEEYIDLFEQAGCKLVSEFGLPRIGVRLYRTASRFAGRFKSDSVVRDAPSSTGGRLGGSRVVRCFRVALLAIARPFDTLLMPFPTRYSDMNILIFQKAAR